MPVPISLLEAFSVLPDPRIDRSKKHRWSELLVIAVCTMLTGGESFYDMEDFARQREPWLRTFLILPGGPPSHDTFNRLFQALDPAAFAVTFTLWTQSLRAAPRRRRTHGLAGLGESKTPEPTHHSSPKFGRVAGSSDSERG